MPKQQTIKNVPDNKSFNISQKKNAATWTLQTIRKGKATITSRGGSTRIVAASTKVHNISSSEVGGLKRLTPKKHSNYVKKYGGEKINKLK